MGVDVSTQPRRYRSRTEHGRHATGIGPGHRMLQKRPTWELVVDLQDVEQLVRLVGESRVPLQVGKVVLPAVGVLDVPRKLAHQHPCPLALKPGNKRP